jgi:hypothetical protein
MYEEKSAGHISRRRCGVLTACYALIATAFLTNFDFRMVAPERFGLVFNDMAERLLNLDWTISAGIIQYEGYVIHGHVFAYFGILPALLRIPFILLGQGYFFYSRISCIAALILFVYSNLSLASRLAAGAPTTSQNARMFTVWGVSLILSGPQIYALASAWVYNEPLFWAAALAALFNYLALNRFANCEWPSGGVLAVMATVAGLALITRAPEGVALYAAVAVFILRGIWDWHCARGERLSWLVTAIAICITFISVACIVNNGRWGSPFAFAPPEQAHIVVAADPHRLKILTEEGSFQVARIPFAVLYYLTGLPFKSLFAGFIQKHYDIVEGPRIPMLLTCPVPFAFAWVGMVAIWRGRRQRMVLPAILIGAQSLTTLVVLGYSSLTLRYTLDFWGAIGALSAVGFNDLLQRPVPRRTRALITFLAIVGISMSLLTLVRYKISNDGVPPAVRFALSQRIRPLLCPNSPAIGTVAKDPPIITPSCPPMW